jgi:hypothetical protein
MLTAADAEEKIPEKEDSLRGMDHFWMKLKSIDSSLAIFDGGKPCIARMSERMKPMGQPLNLVAMAHPYLKGPPFSSRPFKQFSPTVYDQPGLSVFSLVRMGDLPTQ